MNEIVVRKPFYLNGCVRLKLIPTRVYIIGVMHDVVYQPGPRRTRSRRTPVTGFEVESGFLYQGKEDLFVENGRIPN